MFLFLFCYSSWSSRKATDCEVCWDNDGSRNTVAIKQLRFRKGSTPKVGVRVSMRWYRKLWKGTVTAVYGEGNVDDNVDSSSEVTNSTYSSDDDSDDDDDDNIFLANLGKIVSTQMEAYICSRK